MANFKRGLGAATRGGGYGRGRGNVNPRSNRGICTHFKNHGTCKYGGACKFSHDLGSNKSQGGRLVQRDRRADETPDEERAKASYNSWRSLIRKLPQTNDLFIMQNLWNGALEILNGDDRDLKQDLPKDLDNDDYYGRYYIRALLERRAQVSQYDRFIETSRSFLLVMTHSAMVDCLSIDTYVGSLYSFMSGAHGTRAIPFFQHLCEVIVATRTETVRATPQDRLDSTLVVLSAALSELLRRESRARYNENLSDLINSLETAAQLITEDGPTITSNIIMNYVGDLRAVIVRANGLLSDDANNDLEEPSDSVHRSTYPHSIVMPGERHDNDKIDITEIKIFPTRAEIMSDVREFLPSTDPDQPHFLTSKLERHIDTHFRLLRHDTFGKLKDSLGGLMKDIVNNPNQLNSLRPEFGETRTYTYLSSSVTYLVLNKRGGLQARISFPQPHSARRVSAVDRRKWWEESRRLEEGTLLSFIWIQNLTVQHLFFTVSERNTETKNPVSLTSSDKMATITIMLATKDVAAVEMLLDLSRQKTRGVLLEFPHILPATFIPVLENLQKMQHLSRFPFREWILPDRVDGPSGAKFDIPPPLYARHTGFTFPLESILVSGAGTMSLSPSVSVHNASYIAELEEHTELDRGQCVALVAALSREFAFIQGPPGTGKSYLGVKLMKVLLDVKRSANLGPVVVVCYTNHALDQFLEHLINTGIQKIIRVGSQSRSDLLENHNLRNIAQSEAKSKHESWQAATAYEKLNKYEAKSKQILGRVHGKQKRTEWKYFDRHVCRNYHRIHTQFNTVDADGFIVSGRHPFDIWAANVASDDPSAAERSAASTALSMTDLIGKAKIDIQSLSSNERRMLIDIWSEELRKDSTEQFFEMIKDAETTQRHLTYVHEEINRRVLQDADVIGLTTSGLAKNISTLQRVRSKVVICEEAGEVMEPHIISALLPTVEHFIQIGDHQQLRPSINNFRDLSLESDQGILYQLDRSQFERLSVGERGRLSMPVAQLNVQRRMRPDISTLIRETIYDKLIDHPSTHRLPDVVGMRKNVFWLDHDNMEDEKLAEIHHKKSKSNDWEVDMVHALVRHMVRQGVYASSDIAVLTPYTGQLQKLRTAMRNDFEIILSDRDEDTLIKDGFTAHDHPEDHAGVEQHKRKPLEKKKLSDLLRVATVDNFQGEEAKIIIVSLVRSNKNQKVGFLKTTNRINVLLSRAQHGMYLIGNTDTYSNIPMWQKVINMLRAKDSLGSSLGLCCPRHMDTAIQVQQPDDFPKFSPEGGCREACMDRLPDCGHRCQARCHSKAMHEVFSCERPCQRRYTGCDHPCQKKTCGEDCGKCMVALDNIELPCGHFKDSISCYLTQNLNVIQCTVVVNKTVTRCGHLVQVPCSQDVNDEKYLCPDPCGTFLACGHPCPGSCGRCKMTDPKGGLIAEHPKCDRACGRRFGTCNHTCPKRCHDGSDCGLCLSTCEVACKHSRCTLRCHEACAPCIERCTWSCTHQGNCTMPCSAPCSRFPCNERCSRLLPCGHQCPGLCGEDCLPEYCKECGMHLDAQVDMLEFKEYGEINIDETPVIALACGHFFTAETLDGMIGLKDVYNTHPTTGKVLGLEKISSKMAPAIPKCPHCQQPIRQYATQRYNRLINRAVIDEMSKRFIVTGQTDLEELERELTKFETELEETRSDVLKTRMASISTNANTRAITDVSQKLQTRYKTSSQLRSAVIQLQQRVAERHQPAHKLHEATVRAMQRDPSLESALAALKIKNVSRTGERDHRITLGAKMMEIRIDCITMEDKFRVLSAMKTKYGDSAASLTFSGGSPSILVKPFFQCCADFITNCSEKALPRLAVQASLYYARIVRLFETSGISAPEDREIATKSHESAKTLLEEAEKVCEQGFQAAETLLQAVRECLKLLQKEWYEEVTAEEVEAIKKAMVSGPRGIASHSGHWYNCVNGHPFAIGECGMPMELARCPECGASIGGQHHEAVQGVTRAENMEH